MIASNITPETTFREYYDKVYRPLRLSARSEQTRRLYEVSLKHFDDHLGRPATLADLTDEIVTALIASFVERGRSARTGNKTRDQVCAIWRFAARKGHVPVWPDVAPLPELKRTPRALSIEQFDRLLAGIESRTALRGPTRRPICGIPSDVWWLSLLLTIYSTGARIGAVKQLRVDDFDPDSCLLTLRPETQKHRQEKRVKLREKTLAVVQRSISAAPRELLFPWPHCTTHLYAHLNKILTVVGLPHGRFDKFHKIRKTSATLLEIHAGPGTATEFLQHSKRSITVDSYLDPAMMPDADFTAKLPQPQLAGDWAVEDVPPPPIEVIERPQVSQPVSVNPSPISFNFSVDTASAFPIEQGGYIPQAQARVAPPWIPPTPRKHAPEAAEAIPLPPELEAFVSVYEQARGDMSAGELCSTIRSIRIVLEQAAYTSLSQITSSGLIGAITDCTYGLTAKTRRNFVSRLTQFMKWLYESQRIAGLDEVMEDLRVYRKIGGAP